MFLLFLEKYSFEINRLLIFIELYVMCFLEDYKIGVGVVIWVEGKFVSMKIVF